MKKLEKLNFEQFDRFTLLVSQLKSLTGGGQQTSRSGMSDGTNGPDWIDDCTDRTHFSNGTNDDDRVR